MIFILCKVSHVEFRSRPALVLLYIVFVWCLLNYYLSYLHELQNVDIGSWMYAMKSECSYESIYRFKGLHGSVLWINILFNSTKSINNNNNNLLVFPYRWCYLNTESLNKNSKTKQITTATRKKNKHSYWYKILHFKSARVTKFSYL